MNMHLKKTLAVMCITLAETVIAATPNSARVDPPLSPMLIPTVTGLIAPAVLFVGDDLYYLIEGVGICEYHLDIGNGFAGNEKFSLPVNGSVKTQYKVAADENFHVYTLTVTPKDTCNSAGGRPFTANIKVMKRVLNNTADAPRVIPTPTPTKSGQPAGSGGTVGPPLPTVTSISLSPNSPAGKLIFTVGGTGYRKFHVGYSRAEPGLGSTPNVPFESSAQTPFTMTLMLPKPSVDTPGTYTYTAVGYDDCTGSATSGPVVVQ